MPEARHTDPSSSSTALQWCDNDLRSPAAPYASEHFPVHSPWEGIKSIIPSFGAPPSSNHTSSSNASSSSSSPSSSSWFGASSSSTPDPRSNRPEWLDDPVIVGVVTAVGVLGITVGSYYSHGRWWKRIRNANDVTGPMLDQKRWIKGVVTSVGDGDNFRLFHTPGPFYRWPFKLRRIPTTTKELRDETLHIRIAAVDAPENAHFGNPAQPYAKEAWDWMKDTVTGKRMKCQMLRKDQYNRIVAVPYISRMVLPKKALAPLMLKEGMGVVYESGGAEYGPWSLRELKKMEAQARKSKKGLWGVKGSFEHPADYKKRMKIGEDTAVPEKSSSGSRKKRRGFFSLFTRLFTR